MNAGILPYLIVCPLVLLAGVIDAIAGGGGLITLPAYMIAGLPAHAAIATNKLASTMGTSMAVFRYARTGYIRWTYALFCAAFALTGSALGARLSLLISETVLKTVMLFLLPLTAVLVLKGRILDREREPRSRKAVCLLGAAISFCIGMYDGFYGPGTGAFLLILFTAVVRLRLHEANGVTKVINLSSNAASLSVYLLSGNVLVPLGLAAGCFSILGNWIGTTLFINRGLKITKPVMIGVLVVFFLREAYALLSGLS
ncbi:MAG: TSUP family transporter [Clostridia bacterium]|nr:TSUP family transporter [Clostridia bacterium]